VTTTREDDPLGGDERILLVEDEPGVRQVTTLILTRYGYQVSDVPTPHDALALLDTGREVDLVLTDVLMPGMTGFELADRIGVLLPGVPVVFMSGYPDGALPGDVPAPPGPVIPKPFTPKSLARSIRATLDARPG
jgi:CheY-like chemotaxis protein